jgi:hypothetical protein
MWQIYLYGNLPYKNLANKQASKMVQNVFALPPKTVDNARLLRWRFWPTQAALVI